MATFARQFLDDSRAFLTRDYLPKIEGCIGRLAPEQIWSRSNDASNSIGNLMLHLAGSSRYWALEVIGGTAVGRVRQREFDQREPIPSDRLLAELRAAVTEVDRQLASLPDESLLETRSTRDESLTVLWCVYHIVEHFSMHTGQILSMAKSLVGAVASPTGR
jgi:uncharacterized damage-inducible protein DinB